MYSACKLIGYFLVVLASTVAFASSPVLRVCADSNNLPFSNAQRQGFENKLAEMIAQDLGRPLQFLWWPYSPTHAQRIFRAGLCDAVMEAPSLEKSPDITQPYYTSSYVFVTRADRHLTLRSLDDPQLHKLKIGLPIVAGDNAFTPAERELAQRGMTANVVGYSVFSDLSKPNPPADLIRAVEKGDVDVAIAWGPLAGYFAKSSRVALDVSPVCPPTDATVMPFTFSMAMRVRRGDTALRNELDSEIVRRHQEITNLLRSYGVPLIDAAAQSRSCQ